MNAIEAAKITKNIVSKKKKQNKSKAKNANKQFCIAVKQKLNSIYREINKAAGSGEYEILLDAGIIYGYSGYSPREDSIEYIYLKKQNKGLNLINDDRSINEMGVEITRVLEEEEGYKTRFVTGVGIQYSYTDDYGCAKSDTIGAICSLVICWKI
jgi:hypothetical protein